ncbi:hypothetical protein B0H19DRAFT_1068461 [Mycena capillaripes]|nr:hypothetical protein B0H19DRAFT_1068461 [Mycena capillaripes]
MSPQSDGIAFVRLLSQLHVAMVGLLSRRHIAFVAPTGGSRPIDLRPWPVKSGNIGTTNAPYCAVIVHIVCGAEEFGYRSLTGGDAWRSTGRDPLGVCTPTKTARGWASSQKMATCGWRSRSTKATYGHGWRPTKAAWQCANKGLGHKGATVSWEAGLSGAWEGRRTSGCAMPAVDTTASAAEPWLRENKMFTYPT